LQFYLLQPKLSPSLTHLLTEDFSKKLQAVLININPSLPADVQAAAITQKMKVRERQTLTSFSM